MSAELKFLISLISPWVRGMFMVILRLSLMAIEVGLRHCSKGAELEGSRLAWTPHAWWHVHATLPKTSKKRGAKKNKTSQTAKRHGGLMFSGKTVPFQNFRHASRAVARPPPPSIFGLKAQNLLPPFFLHSSSHFLYLNHDTLPSLTLLFTQISPPSSQFFFQFVQFHL